MAKKKVEQVENQVPNKSLEEMSDIEFITYADYLASPYYKAYMTAKLDYDKQERPTVDNIPLVKEEEDVTTKHGKKIYVKKRGFGLFLITLLMLLVLAVAVVGALDITAVNDFVSVYVLNGAKGADVSLLDPFFGMLRAKMGVNVNSVIYSKYLSGMSSANMGVNEIFAMYAMPISALVLVLFALIGFIKGIASLCASKNAFGYYKKYRFGFISIVMFICAIILVVGGLFVANTPISGIINMIMRKGNGLVAGYALYALLIIPILTFILTCCGYKKQKTSKKAKE